MTESTYLTRYNNERILTIDAGNTTVSAGIFENGHLISVRKIKTVRTMSGQEMEYKLRDIAGAKMISGAILSSVVPELDDKITDAVRTVTGCDPLILTQEMETGISLSGYARGSLGMDRLADMAGAVQIAGAPVMVFDLGTCTTASAVDENGIFAGGMIAPGIQISLDTLHERTSKLPGLTAEVPDRLLGLNTAECMQSGTVIGTAAMIEGLAARVESQAGRSVTVVLTGGAGAKVLPWFTRDVIYEPELLFYGLLKIYRLNSDPSVKRLPGAQQKAQPA